MNRWLEVSLFSLQNIGFPPNLDNSDNLGRTSAYYWITSQPISGHPMLSHPPADTSPVPPQVWWKMVAISRLAPMASPTPALKKPGPCLKNAAQTCLRQHFWRSAGVASLCSPSGQPAAGYLASLGSSPQHSAKHGWHHVYFQHLLMGCGALSAKNSWRERSPADVLATCCGLGGPRSLGSFSNTAWHPRLRKRWLRSSLASQPHSK